MKEQGIDDDYLPPDSTAINLSRHFTLEELTHSQTAVRAGIINIPTPAIRSNLTRLANLLEEVRDNLECPVRISSGYRSPPLNTLIGGAKNSQHTQGLAVDFIAPDFGTPKEICQTLLDYGIGFDQLICEGTWVHLSIPAIGSPWRHDVLTAIFEPGHQTRYREGLV